MQALSFAIGVLIVLALGWLQVRRWGKFWGASAGERAMRMSGDVLFVGAARRHVAMTRATTIDAPPESVWPWLAQLGRGAGWYSLDRLDNGGIVSARHVVSWIPEPRVGDAAPIGYLCRVLDGRELTWWAPGIRLVGTQIRFAFDIRLLPQGAGSRVVIRISADATGVTAWPVLWVFEIVDSIMAVRQLVGLRKRIERHGARSADPQRPETGARDQFQLHEVLYAPGGHAGRPGRGPAKRWRLAAIDAGVALGGGKTRP